jgi:hypothetical protein
LPLLTSFQKDLATSAVLLAVSKRIMFLRWEVARPSPNPKLEEDHCLSAVRDCLFNVFAGIPHTWKLPPPSKTWGRAAQWFDGREQ